VVFGSLYLRIVSENSWIYKGFKTLPASADTPRK